MNTKQIIATVVPAIIFLVMVPVFRVYVRLLPGNRRVAWYLGLVTYWIIWGALFPYLLIGKESIFALVRPRRLTAQIALLISIPLLGAALYRLVPNMTYEKPALWIFILLLSTNIGNGFFEELLWRGVYLELFPDNLLLGLIWPSLWFSLWHYAPGSISPDGNPIGLMVGSGMMGLYFAFLARRTGTIWWTIIAHAVGGLIMIL